MYLRRLFFQFLTLIGIGKILYFINVRKENVPILLFHRVSPAFDPFTEPFTPELFEKIIVFLKKSYTFRKLDDLHKTKSDFLIKSAFIVFDDGFEDFFEFARPILKKHNVPVTIFICTEHLDNEDTLWNNEFFSYFLTKTSNILELTINNKKQIFFLSDIPKYNYKIVMKIHQYLLSMDNEERRIIMNEIKDQLKSKSNNIYPLMKRRHLKNLVSDPLIDFQSHTHTHAYLPSLNLKINLINELKISQQTIVECLKKKVDALAYPIGGYNQEVCKISSQYYKYGYAVDEENVQLKKLNNIDYLMKIPRYNITDRYPEEIFFRINGFHKFFTNIIKA